MSSSYRVVRGAGADQTLFTITGSATNSCFIGWGKAIGMCAGSESNHFATWTSGYTLGTTTITLSSNTGLNVGDPIWLTQDDDTTGGDYPAVGDVLICEQGTTWCSASGGGSTNYSPFGGSHSHFTAYTVAACGTSTPGAACSSTTITLASGIATPDYRAARSPQAYWVSQSNYLRYAGIEDLSFDWSSMGSGVVGLHMIYVYNVWERGVRSIAPPAPAQTPHHVVVVRGDKVTLSGNYWFGPEGESGAVNQYSLSGYFATRLRVENNIMQQRQSAFVSDAPWSQSVFAYNFLPGRPDPGVVHHAAGDMMNLSEGNIMLGYYADVFHGTNAFNTLFRNALIGHRYSSSPFGTVQASVHLQSKNRFFNVVGNVLGDNSYITTYETALADSGTSIYVIGWKGSGSGVDPGNDTNVKRTLLRWGNWDSVTSTADTTDGDQTGTRWCGNSSNTGWTTRCASTTEVPSAITNYANPIPATETLPTSWYLPSKPAWFGTRSFPPIGPDVSGGTITQLGGHAKLNPAADCYLNTMGGAVDGSGGPYSFNYAACYPSTLASNPPTATITTDCGSGAGNNCTVSATPLTTMAGTAADDVGVTSVTWACPTCTPTSGTATCATCGSAATAPSWSVASLGLATGANVITVTANDADTQTGTDTITVTYTPLSAAPTILRLLK
jgi:hypothetical protein